MEGNKFEIHIPREKMRDFASLPENEKELRVGDYIDISNEDYFNLFKTDLTDEEKKKELKRFPTKVRISVLEVKNEDNKILIQTGNQQKEIDSSLFLNYSQSINK